MSKICETRYRLLLEYFEELTGQLRSDDEILLTALEEPAVRLLADVIMYLGNTTSSRWAGAGSAPCRNRRDGSGTGGLSYIISGVEPFLL